MIKLSKKAIAANIGAGVIIVTAFGSFMHTTFARPHVEPCSSRYHQRLQMRLDRDGVPMGVADLQAVANGLDEGVAENLTVAEFSQGPTKFAMGVKVAKGTVEQRSTRGIPGGISLPWTPSALEQPTAACLSYNVFLPEDFDFNAGGTLPGLFGTTTNGSFSDTPRFAANLAWHFGGEPKLFLESTTAEGNNTALFKSYDRVIPRGRWINVEQEIILNAPPASNGLARLWIDGKIESEVTGAWLRSDPKVSITGVAANTYFGGSTTTGTATADSTIWISPFEVRWN